MIRKLLYLFIVLMLGISCHIPSNSDKEEKRSVDAVSAHSAKIKLDTIFVPGAPKRITRNIKLDQKGNLLMAAYDDVIVFNGESFVPLEKPAGVESWYAFDVLEDEKGDIWIASDQSGAFRMDGQTGVVSNFTPNDGLGHRRNMCVYEDSNGNIWMGGQGGLSKYDGIDFTNFTTEDGLPHNDINTILEDKNGHLWFGTRGNAGIYDGHTFSELKNEEGKPFFNVWSIIEDQSGDIWLVDSSGLWKYHHQTFTHELPNVWKIYEDASGDFWFTGMGGGSSTLNRMEMNAKQYEVFEVFESGKMLFGVIEDHKGQIWMGGGDGVYVYNGEKVVYYMGL